MQAFTAQTAGSLAVAREQLTGREYEAVVDIGLRQYIREAVRVGLDPWRVAA